MALEFVLFLSSEVPVVESILTRKLLAMSPSFSQIFTRKKKKKK